MSEIMNISKDDMLQMMDDTSQFITKSSVDQFAASMAAAQASNSLTDNVEFWKWMARNYKESGIFNTNESMLRYINQSPGNEAWFMKQVQGKGYEWDWISHQRQQVQNILKRYDAGDVANRAASDVTEINMLTGRSTDYQMKAYTGKTNPDLSHTPKDMTVITNAEKVDVVKSSGYSNVEGYMDAPAIKDSTNKRMEQVKKGKAYTTYNVRNVVGTMAKAGLVGGVIGVGTETIVSYKSWKTGQITDEEYIGEILKAGGNSAVTAGMTSGVMIPVSAAITAAGVSTLVTIPIAFVVGGAIDSIVAPCFGRGKYREILQQAKYYQDIDSVYYDLIGSMQNTFEQYNNFVDQVCMQNVIHQRCKEKSMAINKDLKDLYNSI